VNEGVEAIVPSKRATPTLCTVDPPEGEPSTSATSAAVDKDAPLIAIDTILVDVSVMAPTLEREKLHQASNASPREPGANFS